VDARALLADLRRKKKKTGLLVDPEPEIQHGILSSIGRGAKTAGANVMRGLLGDTSPEQTAMMARFIERPDYYGEMVNPDEAMKTGATSALLATPVVGDIAGAAMDAHMYATDPASRTPFNFALSGLGVLPMIPAASQVKAARDKIKAFHGSPHDFPPVRELEMPDGAVVYQSMGDAVPDGARVIKEHPLGRFDMSKLGTGEGAQAYGHGLYFAESEDVAKQYRDELSKGISYDGKPIYKSGKQVGSTGSVDLDDDLIANLGDVDEAIAFWAKDLDSDSPALREFAQERIDELQSSRSRLEVGGQGHMYQVEIDATPDELLDWDLPLSEQGEGVRKSVDRLGVPDVGGETTGRDLLREKLRGLSDNNGVVLSPEGALSSKGIKGIKYKDGFSRGKEGGTSNYVIFDDRLISIAKKYGVSIPVAAAILTRMTGKDATNGYQEAET